MNQIDKNTVEAKNQLKTKSSVFFENKEGRGLKVLFVGNSITLHGYKEEIGWYGENYGMAASAKEKDYVHQTVMEINKRRADTAVCICQVASWEREYAKDADLEAFNDARNFGADIIVMRIIENCPSESYNEDVFKSAYKKFIDFLNPDGKAKVILTTSFWKHIGDDAVIAVGRERNYPTVYLGELGEDDGFKAIGLFEHSGVANHPGDKGMKAIADLIFDEIARLL